MQNQLRQLRRDRGLTLAEVAARCRPRTTAQTIGRLEMGSRTLSVPWLMRLAPALGVDPAALIGGGQARTAPTLTLAATLDAGEARAVTRERAVPAPTPEGEMLAIDVRGGVGDYRAGDRLWCRKLGPEGFARALNRDVLVPRGGGRLAFGRLTAIEDERLQLVPPRPGARQIIVVRPPWIAVVATLVRDLGA